VWRAFCDLLDVILTVTAWIVRRLWRFRAGLVPVWTAAAVAVGGTMLPPRWWWAPITVALVVAPGLFWLGDRLSDPWQRMVAWLVPDALDSGRKGVLDRETERAYLALLLLTCGGWVSWIADRGWPGWWWFGGFFVVLAGPWWWHRGWRRRKRPNRWAMRWPHVADAIKEFEGSRVIAHSGDKLVTELKVVLRPGLTVNNVGDRGLQVASALSPRLRPGAVTLSSGGAARRVSVRIVPRDPWQGVIPHPLPPLGSVDLDRDDRVMIGRLEDRRALLHKMRQHTLVVAKSGGGKSVMLDSLLAWMVLSRSPVVAIDMASGVSLGEWEPCLAAPLATNAAQAKELLRGVMAVVEHREREMKRLKVKTWPHGDLFVVIDEFPTLVRTGGKEVITILTILAERMRKTRLWLYAAAQNGTKDDLGSTEFRAQMMVQLGGRMDSHMNGVMWAELVKQGWDGTGLQTGCWLLRDATRDTPRQAKGALLTDAEQTRLVAEASKRDNRAELDSGSLHALRGVEQAPPFGTSLADGGKPTADAVAAVHGPRRLTVVQSARSPLDELDERVFEELPDVEQGAGVGASPIAAQLQVDRGQVERALRRLQKAGRVEHLGGRSGWVRR
jgi:hypothetical protein